MLKVGFIGLGVMGAPMAMCVLKGGHPLRHIVTGEVDAKACE